MRLTEVLKGSNINQMKKFLPLVLLLVGTLVLVGAFLFVKNKKEDSSIPEEERVSLISTEKMPSISLSKSDDGHYLNLKIEKLEPLSPESLDYELLYDVPGKEQPQGTSSSVEISGKSSYDVEILLGSESSGKFRYDEGVESGTLTLKFRNDKGKLIGRTKTVFDLASGKLETSSY